MTAVNMAGTRRTGAARTRLWLSSVLVLALAAVTLVAAAPPAHASHFRYRDISWQRVQGNTVELTMKMADRRSYSSYNNPDVGDTWEESVDVGDGSTTFTGEVIAVSTVDDWFIAEVSATHTYDDPGPHTIEWSGCCTLSSLKNSPDESLTSRAVVDLRNGNNSSPKTQVLPIMPIPADGEQSFRVPALDGDGDIVEFRLATESDTGGVDQPPALSIDSNGIGTWDTSGLDEGLYMATVVAADDRGAESQITWLLDLGGEPIGDPPTWTVPTPPERTTFQVRGGDSTAFTVAAEDVDEDDLVTITSLGLPAGVECDDTDNTANPAQLVCTFEPADSGFELLTFIAQDQHGNADAVRSYVVGSGRYVALGDGLSSGEGLGDYDPDTDVDGVNECHRSPHAFPHLLADNSSVPGWFDTVACSGAALPELAAPVSDEGPQLDVLNDDVTLITLTVGDELGLPAILADCAGSGDCEADHGADVEAALTAMDGDLSALLRQTKNRSPRARVLVVGQPRLFANPPAAECDGLSTADQEWANEQVEALNVLLASHARGFAEFVDAQAAVDGHEQCSDTPWADGFRPAADAHDALADVVLDAVDTPPGITINVLPGETHVLDPVTVAPGQAEASFSTQWPGSDVIMTLTTPSGETIDRNNVPAGSIHDRGPTYEVLRIFDPEPGEWGVSLFGSDVAPGGEETRFVYQALPTEIVDEATEPPPPPSSGDPTVVVDTGDEASTDTLLHLTLRSPMGGSPSVAVRDTSTSDPDGFVLLPVEAVVSAPSTFPGNPLLLTFRLHTSALPQDATAADVVLFRDGVPVPGCEGDGADPDPCVAGVRVDGDVITLVARSTSASVWSLGVPAPPETPAQEPLVCQENDTAPFTDMAGNVHAPAVGCLVRLDVARGMSASEYGPAGDVTRGQMATFVANALRAADVALPDGTDAFADDGDSVHEGSINALAQANIVSGTTDTTFEPRARVTRAQVASFLVAAHWYATGQALDATTDAFGDDDGSVHESAINAAADAGLVLGVDADSYQPQATTRRDQMASFIARLLERVIADLA